MQISINVRALIIALALPLCSYAQHTDIKRQIDTQLIIDGREPRGMTDSISKEELVRAFNEDKVTVGHTNMHVAGFKISWLPPKKDLVGPYGIDTYFSIDAHGVDTTARHTRIANFLTRILIAAHSGDKVFIDAIYAIDASGELCKIKQATVFVLR